MLSYLEKFNNLPKNIKDQINAPGVMARISELGQSFGVNLATVIMRVMAKEIKLDALGAYFINELNVSAENARTLEQKLRREVFAGVIDFLLGADQGPKLVFAEEDEHEVRHSAQKVSTIDFDSEVEGYVEEIVKQSRINFENPLAAGKFRQVLKTYLRGTRDKLAVGEVLVKAAELGGIALNRDTADRVLLIADNYIRRRAKPATPLAKIPLPQEEKLISPLPPAAEYDLSASLREQGKLKEEKSQPVRFSPPLDASHELAPPVPVIVAAPVPVPVAPPAARKAVKEVIAGKPLNKETLRRIAPKTVIDNTVKVGSGKVRMDDIRYTPHAVGPIEELQAFSLINFRRLDPDPIKAIEKIKNKLELLGRDEYSKKIEGIVAWHQSPLNRLYLAVCRRSLDEGLSLGAIIDREQKKDKAFLKADELSAIISLNRSLKF